MLLSIHTYFNTAGRESLSEVQRTWGSSTPLEPGAALLRSAHPLQNYETGQKLRAAGSFLVFHIQWRERGHQHRSTMVACRWSPIWRQLVFLLWFVPDSVECFTPSRCLPSSLFARRFGNTLPFSSRLHFRTRARLCALRASTAAPVVQCVFHPCL
jgi:hypothetical protein